MEAAMSNSTARPGATKASKALDALAILIASPIYIAIFAVVAPLAICMLVGKAVFYPFDWAFTRLGKL